MSGVDYAKRVRLMWSAFQRDGIVATRPYVDDDIEFIPTTGGEMLRGWDALVDFWEHEGHTHSAVAHAIEQHGDCVLVHGSLRMFRDGGFVDTQPSWVYFFRDGRLRRAVAFASREDALAAIERHCGGA
jgi:ketosteroid isomerase-like protein